MAERLKELFNLTRAIRHCIDGKFHQAALILSYAGIDSAAWVWTTAEFSTRKDFIGWVDGYMLPAMPLGCDAIDLYAARCALVHTGSDGSQLAADGKAKKIWYVWRPAPIELLRQLIARKPAENAVAVYGDDLASALERGLIQLEDELNREGGDEAFQAWRQKARMKAGRLLTYTAYSEEPGLS